MDYLPHIVVALVVLFALFQLRVLFAAKRRKGTPAPPLEDLLGAGVAADGPTVFYFYGEHCGPCRAIAPMVDALAERHGNLIKIDVVRQPEVARRFGIMATPAFVLIADGTIEEVALGRVSERQLEAWLG
jgi:thioredoxin 1